CSSSSRHNAARSRVHNELKVSVKNSEHIADIGNTQLNRCLMRPDANFSPQHRQLAQIINNGKALLYCLLTHPTARLAVFYLLAALRGLMAVAPGAILSIFIRD